MGDWKTVDGVTTIKTREVESWLDCRDCNWHEGYSEKLSSARKKAHRHIQETGHTVDVNQTRLFTYGPQK